MTFLAWHRHARKRRIQQMNAENRAAFEQRKQAAANGGRLDA